MRRYIKRKSTKKRTVRQLAGEIWGEMNREIAKSGGKGEPFEGYKYQALDVTIDIVLGVLARHIGTVIVDHEGLPVTPLPLHDNQTM